MLCYAMLCYAIYSTIVYTLYYATVVTVDPHQKACAYHRSSSRRRSGSEQQPPPPHVLKEVANGAGAPEPLAIACDLMSFKSVQEAGLLVLFVAVLKPEGSVNVGPPTEALNLNIHRRFQAGSLKT